MVLFDTNIFLQPMLSKEKIIEGTTPPAPKIKIDLCKTLIFECLKPNSNPATSVLCPIILLPLL